MSTNHGPGCDCCTGLSDRTPVELDNRPGLSAVAYRTGTYARFRTSMLAGLSRESRPALAALKTREPDDFAIALIDAWSVAADVLTFYAERIANEHYLGTATERRSIAGMTALIGYRLKPGVAAQAWLAFTLETAPGSPLESAIPPGAKVQTLPGPGEIPQTFETIERLDAVAAWNRPLLTMREPHTPRSGESVVRLAGAALNLRRGDQLLFVADDWSKASAGLRWNRVRVVGVATDAAARETEITFTPPLNNLAPVAGTGVRLYALRGQAALFGFNAPDPRLLDPDVLGALKTNVPVVVSAANEWVFAGVTGGEVLLDGLYEGLEPGGWAVLSSGDALELAAVTAVRETAKSAYALSARVTALSLDRTDDALKVFGGANTRSTIVQFRSEEFTLAETAITGPLHGQEVPLSETLPGNAAVRRVLVRGKRPRAARVSESEFIDNPPWPEGESPLVVRIEGELDGLPGMVRWTLRPLSGDDFSATGPPGAVTYLPAEAGDDIVGEVATVEAAKGTAPVATLLLTAGLTNVYDRQGETPVEIFGNVADATHGETVANEVLGSGDGARPFQRFTLRKPPLTYVPAPTLTGGSSTLEVRVNGLLWHESPTLFAAGRRDRVYVTSTEDDGKTTLTFGDGEAGARLPTGPDNVAVKYRAGLGLPGMAKADQITLAMTRPLGLKAVTNPLPAAGAQDPQAAEDARGNAPRSVLTLGRVVSLQDYADFANDFSGVGKAAATWTWDGARRGVAVTVAAATGKPIPEGASLLTNLRASLRNAGSGRVPLELRDFQLARFNLLATLRVAPDYEPAAVREAVADALLARYSFESRTFGQGVSYSEVVEAIHAVPGVDGVRVDRLHREGDPASVATFLVAAAPLPGGPPGAPAAEILTLAPEGVALEVGW